MRRHELFAQERRCAGRWRLDRSMAERSRRVRRAASAELVRFVARASRARADCSPAASVLFLEAERADQAVGVGARDIQTLGGLLYVPAGLAQCLAQQVLLELPRGVLEAE